MLQSTSDLSCFFVFFFILLLGQILDKRANQSKVLVISKGGCEILQEYFVDTCVQTEREKQEETSLWHEDLFVLT